MQRALLALQLLWRALVDAARRECREEIELAFPSHFAVGARVRFDSGDNHCQHLEGEYSVCFIQRNMKSARPGD